MCYENENNKQLSLSQLQKPKILYSKFYPLQGNRSCNNNSNYRHNGQSRCESSKVNM